MVVGGVRVEGVSLHDNVAREEGNFGLVLGASEMLVRQGGIDLNGRHVSSQGGKLHRHDGSLLVPVPVSRVLHLSGGDDDALSGLPVDDVLNKDPGSVDVGGHSKTRPSGGIEGPVQVNGSRHADSLHPLISGQGLRVSLAVQSDGDLVSQSE